jgi:hypothetical protein
MLWFADCAGPIKKDFDHFLKLGRATKCLENICLDLAFQPILAACVAVVANPINTLRKLSSLKVGSLKRNLHRPSWIVERADTDAMAMLPLSVTLGAVPSLQSGQGVHVGGERSPSLAASQ